MVVSLVLTRRVGRDISGVWVSSDISSIVSAFSRSRSFTQAMTDVGPPED